MKSLLTLFFYGGVFAALFVLPGRNASGLNNLDSAKTSGSLKIKTLTLRDFGQAGLGGDDTRTFQRALAEASRLRRALEIPATRAPYRVAPLYIRSGTTLLLDSGATIQALPGFEDGQKLLNIADVTTVQIIGYGAFLKMNRAEYKTGEYRHCLSINGSTRVVVKGITCLSPGGNGVYVGGSEQKPFSEDVELEDIRIENSLRAGFQIVSARNLSIRRSQVRGSGGPYEKSGLQKTARDEMPGFQFSPSGSGARLENVHLEDNTTIRVEGDGVRFVLSRLTSASPPLSVVVLRHRDSDAGGSSFSGTDEPSSGQAVRGQVSFEDCSSEAAQAYGVLFSFWSASGVRASLSNLTVINANTGGSTIDNVAVAVKRGGGGHDPIGNVEFARTTIRDTRRVPRIDYYFSFVDYSRIGIRNVIFRDSVQLTGARHKKPLGLFQGEGVGEIKRVDDAVVRTLWQTAEKRDSAGSPQIR